MLTDTVILTDEQERRAALIDNFIAGRRGGFGSVASAFYYEGVAGTGKTVLLSHTGLQFKHACLCTLTGKAASILRRKTGLPACTLHSFFYRLVESGKDKRGKPVLRFERAHDQDQLAGSLVLLDEVSMIPDEIAETIRRTGTKIIACGDPGQLPPVKGAPSFTHPDFTLTEIHRQALQSPILRQAHAVRLGGDYHADGTAFRIAREVTVEEALQAGIVLCWTNRTRQSANAEARAMRGRKRWLPEAGEPLMCERNAAQFGIFNGAIYTLLEDFPEDGVGVLIDVDGVPTRIPLAGFAGIVLRDDLEPTTSFAFGYALTVHTAQGSEWDSVILIDEYRRQEDRRKWLYTAISRAAKSIIVIRH